MLPKLSAIAEYKSGKPQLKILEVQVLSKL
jgi:hypothetical protein